MEVCNCDAEENNVACHVGHKNVAEGGVDRGIEDSGFDEAQVAAAAFLARYNGRTLDAYRYDLRTYFQWAADARLAVLDAKRPHIELYRTAMEQKGLAPSTIDAYARHRSVL